MASAPHSLASASAVAVLREGGNAIEAMIAAAATISVVYPHMNGIGGDSFWLIHEPGKPPTTIDACGQAALTASRAWYREHAVTTIPFRGPLAANTVAGTVGGWGLAQRLSRTRLGGRLPLSRLLGDAIHYAQHGHPVTRSYTDTTQAKRAELGAQPGFAARFMPTGEVPRPGSLLVQSKLATTLARIAAAGTDDFYQGELARSIASDLAALGSPLAADDFTAYRATERAPVYLAHSRGTLYNMAPPTQGMVSLALLGIADRLGLDAVEPESADYLHRMVEATKQAFFLRDRHVTDPTYMTVAPQSLLSPAEMDRRAARVDLARALPWPAPQPPSDTVWMGVIDDTGRAVSFIQSIYHEFGSGIVLDGTGVNWQNRGASFSLDASALNTLEPGRKPFHTLNPALAHLHDGRVMVYGTMGGEGQPQTQAAVFTRHVVYGQDLQASISAPRWLLGRTWGQATQSLKIESRFDGAVIDALRARGHEVEVYGDFDETMGHAGAIVRAGNGVLEGASDPRSDGAAIGY
ncbi:MAG: gamma-glutamyltransferase family protein [Proteobacteria bacterium]|nr:gamma-glutamyltransferase family protein [Burkholderiales bacterium]